MKRIAIGLTAVVALMLTIFIAVGAEARARGGWCGHGWHHAGPLSWLAHDLKLSDAQLAQVRTLWQTERPGISADIHQLLAENKEMDAMAAQETPEPDKVKEIADREATTVAALLVEKEFLQSKIYRTVLTPEQRAKVDELQKKWESRLDRAAERLGSQSTEE